MEIKELYKYTREDGGTTVSPIKPECEYTLMYRVVAKDGYEVTLNSIDTYCCIDTVEKDGWYEVPAKEVEE